MSVGILAGNIANVNVINAIIDATSVAANTSAEQTFTVDGLKVTDTVFVNKPDLDAGLAIGNTRVSADDTLAITFVNSTAAAIDPAAENYKILVVGAEGLADATNVSR